jgi:hypothetical protein
MWQSADTIRWLDYPAPVVLPRLIRRSAARTATRAELFGGNRETAREWQSSRTHAWLRAARPAAGNNGRTGTRARHRAAGDALTAGGVRT